MFLVLYVGSLSSMFIHCASNNKSTIVAGFMFTSVACFISDVIAGVNYDLGIEYHESTRSRPSTAYTA